MFFETSHYQLVISMVVEVGVVGQWQAPSEKTFPLFSYLFRVRVAYEDILIHNSIFLQRLINKKTNIPS